MSIRLETKRLILREWQYKDMAEVIEGLNNFEVSKWLAYVPYPYTINDATAWISYCTSNFKNEENNSFHFAIELKSESKVIGGTSLEKIDKVQGIVGGGGIWLNENYHGNGFGTEAFSRRIDFAFNELYLRRIENGFFIGNTASSKMQEKLGYKIEGKRRKRFLCLADSEYKDEIITGLLKEEWIPFSSKK